MRKKAEFYQALQSFAKDIGVPIALIYDPSGEQSSNQVNQFTKEYQLKRKLLEESTQWTNLAEQYIGILKSAVWKNMYESDCPLHFWDYCIEWRVQVHNLTEALLWYLRFLLALTYIQMDHVPGRRQRKFRLYCKRNYIYLFFNLY